MPLKGVNGVINSEGYNLWGREELRGLWRIDRKLEKKLRKRASERSVAQRKYEPQTSKDSVLPSMLFFRNRSLEPERCNKNMKIKELQMMRVKMEFNNKIN